MQNACDELRLYWEEYAEGALEEPLARDLAGHLEGCARCRESYPEIARLVRELRSAFKGPVSERVWEGAIERIRAEGGFRAPQVRRLSGWRLGLAAAAAGLVAGIFVRSFVGPRPPQPIPSRYLLQEAPHGKTAPRIDASIASHDDASATTVLKWQTPPVPRPGDAIELKGKDRIFSAKVLSVTGPFVIIRWETTPPERALRDGEIYQVRSDERVETPR